MRGISIRTTRVVLLAICLFLFIQPVATYQVSGRYLEPITNESKRWSLMFLNQRVGYDHLYGNFSYGRTYSEPPAYVVFFINETKVINEVEREFWYVINNATSEPYECNFSTFDYSIGIHEIMALSCDGPGEGLSGGGNYYFFEHQDRSSEQVLYTGASITIATAYIASLFGIGFASYRLFKWYSKRPRRPTDSRSVSKSFWQYIIPLAS